jgi:hypothetical protein
MLAVVLLQGCSTIKLAYNQAPDLTYWWLDGYVDFNDQQTPKVRDGIAALFAWHRSNELPKVASWLQKGQVLMPQNITPAQACSLYDETRGMVAAIIDNAMPALVEWAPTVTADQLLVLQKKQKKTIDEFSSDYITNTPAQRNAKRLKSAISRSEMVYGKLEAVQIAAIEKSIATSSFDPALTLKERLQRQKDGVDMLRKLAETKPAPAAVQTTLRAYIARSATSTDPVYRAYAENLVRESCDTFAAVHATTTPAQRAKAVQTLKGYEQDVRTLAGQGGS